MSEENSQHCWSEVVVLGGVNSVPDKFNENSGNMKAIEGLDGSPLIPSLTGKLFICTWKAEGAEWKRKTKET